MPNGEIGRIWTTIQADITGLQQKISALNIPLNRVSVTLKDAGQGLQVARVHIRSLADETRRAGASLKGFGDHMLTTLGIAVRWFIAYRAIRTVLQGLAKAFEDIKRLQVQEIFTPIVFEGKKMEEVFSRASLLTLKWGGDVYQTYEAIIRFGRVLKDFGTAVYLTDVALETVRASGQGLNEVVTSMIGLITNLDVSIEDVSKAMDILYSAALKTDEPMDLLGESFKGGTNALQSFTDAMDQGALGLQNLGFSFGQIAAIFNILITRTDRTGQSIGSLFAKLAGGLKDNQKLVDIYKQVGIQLEYSERLLPLLAQGWEKMNINQKNAVISSAGIVGVGRDLAEVFFKALPDALDKYNEILDDTDQRHYMAAKMMDTIVGKTERWKAATQLLGLTFKDELLPPLSAVVDFLTYFIRKITLAAESLMTVFVKTPIAGVKQLYELLKPPALGKTFFEDIKDRYEAVMKIGEDWQKDWKELWEEYLKEAEWEKLWEEGLLPKEIEKRLEERKDIFIKALGIDTEGLEILQDASRVVRKYRMEIDIAVAELGVFATQQEINQVKTELLNREIKELTRLLPKVADETSKLQIKEAIAEANLELQEMETNYGNIVELAKRLAKATYEGKPTLADLVDKSKRLASTFEDIYVRGIKGIIEGTKTWRDILADIGDVVLEEIISKLVRISIGAEAPGGGGIGGIASVLTSISAIFSGVSGFLPTRGTGAGTPMGVKIPYGMHEGGFVEDQVKYPRFQFGGEVPILARPGEYVVSERPAQRYKGLLEEINAGRQVSGGKNVNYYIYAIDARSFAQMLYQNKASVHMIVQEAKRFNMPGFQKGDWS